MHPAILEKKPTLVEAFGHPALTQSLWDVWDGTYLGYDWGEINAAQVEVVDSRLHVRMSRRATPSTRKDGKVREFDTGYLTTAGRLSIEHGAVEIRAQIPADPVTSAGVWCGLWLRPEDKTIGGEIDVVESFGDLGANATSTTGYPNRYEATVHWDQTGKNKTVTRSPWPVTPLSEWHTYGLVKTPEEIIFYLDRQELGRVKKADNEAKWAQAFPPGARYHLRLCTQAGSAYWGQPTSQTAQVSEMVIDQVTVWDLAHA